LSFFFLSKDHFVLGDRDSRPCGCWMSTTMAQPGRTTTYWISAPWQFRGWYIDFPLLKPAHRFSQFLLFVCCFTSPWSSNVYCYNSRPTFRLLDSAHSSLLLS
jgi:hypothetical protein